jgi:hypothetical protein
MIVMQAMRADDPLQQVASELVILSCGIILHCSHFLGCVGECGDQWRWFP